MKIAFVSQPWNSLCPPVRGGSIAIWTYQVARRLASRHEVAVYSARSGRDQAPMAVEDEVRYRLVPVAGDRLMARLTDPLAGIRGPRRPSFWSPRYHRLYAERIADELARSPPDVIHIHNVAPFAPLLRQACPHAAIVLHMHCDWLVELDRAWTGRHLAAVDLMIGCSGHVTDSAKQAFPDLGTAVVANGVDLDYFRPSASPPEEERRSILFVSRISPEKGVHVLCEAFNEVARRHPTASLRVVGSECAAAREFLVDISRDPRVRALDRYYSSDYGKACRALLDEPARRRTDFPGHLPHDELAAAFHDAAVVVAPSLAESFGMSLAEAAACARPTIGTRVGGMPEVIAAGQTGLLVEPDDAKALAEAIGALLSDPAARAALGAAGRARAERRFSWETVAETLIARYHGLGIGP